MDYGNCIYALMEETDFKRMLTVKRLHELISTKSAYPMSNRVCRLCYERG